MTICTVEILLPLPFDKSFTYQVPLDVDLLPGDYVLIPFRKNNIIGIVWKDVSFQESQNFSYQLKNIEKKFPFSPMPKNFRQFLEWVSQYTMTPLGLVLKMALNEKKVFQTQKKTLYRFHSFPEGLRQTEKRQNIIQYVQQQHTATAQEIYAQCHCSPQTLTQMANQNILQKFQHEEYFLAPQTKFTYNLNTLTIEQQEAYDMWQDTQDTFSVSVIDGVTGSGKTELYFAAIKDCLEKEQQILVLLPEIALTGQWIKRFQDAFGVMPCLWHSDLTPKQRAHTWHTANQGQPHVIIGARSSLFLPFQNLGLIIVDEEHEHVYKQEEQVLYHARDMAVLRAKKENIPIFLVSATPSLETIANIEAGKYQKLSLPSRFGSAKKTPLHVLDLKKTPPEKNQDLTTWLSPILKQKILDNLQKGQQTLLFLNRRGYAPLYLCRTCGHRFTCFQCSSWLVQHVHKNILQCHHCGYQCQTPKTCPECNEEENFAACGPGVERLAEEVEYFFPKAKVYIASSETMSTAQESQNFVDKMTSKEIDIVIGTQILAKGYHFPDLTLVGVVDADLGLAGGDLRAAEKTFQLLWQVSGRAGREKLPGQVYLQSWHAEHPVIQALKNKDRDGFYETEIYYRSQQELPPFGKLVAFIISSQYENKAHQAALQIASLLAKNSDYKILGPAPAPLFQIRGKFRFRILLKSSKDKNVQQYIHNALNKLTLDKHIKLQIDIDPQSFL